jgi:hypothetical protein
MCIPAIRAPSGTTNLPTKATCPEIPLTYLGRSTKHTVSGTKNNLLTRANRQSPSEIPLTTLEKTTKRIVLTKQVSIYRTTNLAAKAIRPIPGETHLISTRQHTKTTNSIALVTHQIRAEMLGTTLLTPLI